ncbi:hypothetical protein SYNPS1DRAFT_29403, partial [Syncephalis pseudoplumigaleata]
QGRRIHTLVKACNRVTLSFKITKAYPGDCKLYVLDKNYGQPQLIATKPSCGVRTGTIPWTVELPAQLSGSKVLRWVWEAKRTDGQTCNVEMCHDIEITKSAPKKTKKGVKHGGNKKGKGKDGDSDSKSGSSSGSSGSSNDSSNDSSSESAEEPKKKQGGKKHGKKSGSKKSGSNKKKKKNDSGKKNGGKDKPKHGGGLYSNEPAYPLPGASNSNGGLPLCTRETSVPLAFLGMWRGHQYA